MTRAEHLRWCKDRAILELDHSGDPKQAIISMMSDIGKHPETDSEVLRSLCTMMLLSGKIRTRQEAINFINGFN